MKHFLKIKIGIVLFVSVSYAQTVRIPTTNGKAFIESESEIKGSKLISKDWLNGKILLLDNKITNPVDLNVDIYNHQFIMKGDDNKKIILDDNKISGAYIPINGQEKLFLRIEGGKFAVNKNKNKIYVVHTPKSNFIIEERSKIIKDYGDSNGYSKSGKQYKIETTFYVLNAQGKYEKVRKVNKKSLAKIFPSKSHVIKESNIDIKKPNTFERLYVLLAAE